jgi:hypothetical protein
MLSNFDSAKQINQLAQDVFLLLDESVTNVRKTCAQDEADASSKAVGKVVGPIVLCIMEPLYAMHPELKPHNWDE